MVLIGIVYGRRKSVGAVRGGRTYTYRVDEEVGVGDIVLVPPTWLTPIEQEATVVTLNAPPLDEDVTIESIIRVVERALS